MSWAVIIWSIVVVAFAIYGLTIAPNDCASGNAAACGTGPWVAAVILLLPALMLAWALTRPKDERQPKKSETSGQGPTEAVESGSDGSPRPPGTSSGKRELDGK